MSTSQGNMEQEISDKIQKYKEEAKQSIAQLEGLRANFASQRETNALARSGDSQAYDAFIASFETVKRIDTEIIKLCDSASKTQELVEQIKAKSDIARVKRVELNARAMAYIWRI